MIKKNIVKSFGDVLNCFVDGKVYKTKPPQGPPENLPTLTNEELASLQQTLWGEDLAGTGYAYQQIKLVEDPAPIEVSMPTVEDLKDINVCGIDGSNQRIEKSSFYFLLARASIVEFRYSINNLKPYFYNRTFDTSGVLWVDGNVFNDDVRIYTEDLAFSEDGSVNILSKIAKDIDYPFLVRHDPEKIDKSPSSHALGWAVKLQQALELACIKYIPTNIKTVCIKDGPLFSTSVSPSDTQEGLNPIFGWQDQVLVACSKRIKDSSLIAEALKRNVDLRNYWFPNQNINETTLKFISTDSLLLPRILKPGFRTPLMEALPVARQGVVNSEPRLMPLSCYYLSKHQPHTYIRLEIPKFMWERDKKRVEDAIRIVAWQHELGHRAPLVQLAADRRCQLTSEKDILEKQTMSVLFKKQLDFPEDY